MFVYDSQVVRRTKVNSRPALGVSPLTTAFVEPIDLPPSLCRVAQIHRFHLLGLDDYHAKVRSSHGVFQVFDLRSNCEVFVVVRLVARLSGRWVLE